MKDNYAHQEDEGIGAFFEQRREELRAQKRSQRRAPISVVCLLLGGFGLISLFDPRLGCGMFFVSAAVYTGFRFL